MYSFRNDYSEGAHPAVMAALERTNLELTAGYGMDPYCQSAADTIRTLFGCSNADVHFLPGGTVANLTAITAFLQQWECVVSPASGHIFVHETGAIEAGGHKVLSVDCPDGKLTPAQLQEVFDRQERGENEFMVVPRLVYLSNATEWGTIYTRSELYALHETCQKLGMYLYMDGARLAQALVAEGSGVTCEDIGRCCDAFYIGGTKNGLLFGEAMVIVREELKSHFRYVMKQRGAILAKGRLLGVQFCAYFENGLWLELARRSVQAAQRIQKAFVEKGYTLYAVSPTNQIFLTVTNAQLQKLQKDFIFEIFSRPDADHAIIRFATSWATTDEAVEALEQAI